MTLNEFQDYLGKRAEEFLEKSDQVSTDILKDLYRSIGLVYQDVYAKSFIIDLGSEGNGPFSKVLVDTYKRGDKDEG